MNAAAFQEAVERLVDYAGSAGRENACETEGVQTRARRHGVEIDTSPEYELMAHSSALGFIVDLTPKEASEYARWEGRYTEHDHERLKHAAYAAVEEQYRHIGPFLHDLLRDEVDVRVEQHVARYGHDLAPRALRAQLTSAIHRDLGQKWPLWNPRPLNIEKAIDASIWFKGYVQDHKRANPKKKAAR